MKNTAGVNKSTGSPHPFQSTGKIAARAAGTSHGRRNALWREEVRQLREQVETLVLELDRCRAELTAAEFGAAIANRQGELDESFTRVEAQNHTVINLFVAATRLHSSTDRASVLAAIREILGDLIGSQATAVFELDASGSALLLVESSGIDAATFARISVGSGCIGKVAATGAPCFGDGNDGQPIACIPLKIGPRVTGVVALFRLLEQKPELHGNDHELLDFLSTHAALALYRTAARSDCSAASRART